MPRRDIKSALRNSRRLVVLSTLFVLVACLLLVGMDMLRSTEDRDLRLAQARTANSNLARSIAQHADDKVGEADTILKGLVERLEHDGSSEAALLRLHPFLAGLVEELPQLHGLFIYGEYGEWLVNSLRPGRWHFNNADRDYFQHHARVSYGGAHIGEPIRSRSTGDWIITVSRRFSHPDGSFGGVVLATLDMAYFNEYYGQFDLGEEGYIALGLMDGSLIARYPFDEALLGDNQVGHELFMEHFAPERNSGSASDNASDAYLRVFRDLERFPLFVALAQSRDEVLQPWRQDALRHTLTNVFLVLVLAAFGYLMVQQLRRRVEVEGRLRHTSYLLRGTNQELERLAMRDGLTGIANRRRFDELLAAEFRRATREHTPLALILADIDYFKRYNDFYGHPAGDACLRQVAALLADCCVHRASDLVARYGGEEVAILLPDTDLSGAKAVAERLRRAISEARITHADSPLGHITLSLGIHACRPRMEQDPQHLVDAADKALYQAKHQGRNCVATYLQTAAV